MSSHPPFGTKALQPGGATPFDDSLFGSWAYDTPAIASQFSLPGVPGLIRLNGAPGAGNTFLAHSLAFRLDRGVPCTLEADYQLTTDSGDMLRFQVNTEDGASQLLNFNPTILDGVAVAAFTPNVSGKNARIELWSVGATNLDALIRRLTVRRQA